MTRRPGCGPTRVSRDDELVVTGELFRFGCDDTGQDSGCNSAPSEESPMRDVALVLTQGQRFWSLGSADAAPKADRYRLEWRAALPAEVATGPAVLRADVAELRLRITR